MAFKFELKSLAGDDLGTIETGEANWRVGDDLIGHGNSRWRVVGTGPGDGREIDGVLIVEPT